MSQQIPLVVRQAGALLARSLGRELEDGRSHVWLRPGLRLDAPAPLGGAAPAGKTPAAAVPGINPPDTRQESPAVRLARLKEEAANLPGPKALGTLRETFVFSDGTAMADLVFVGEAPGAEEESQGKPFVGPAGELLNRILKAMGLERSQVYITNIVKYRPRIPGEQGSRNRKPDAREMAACLPILRGEIEIIRPRVIVALGGAAFAGLSGDPDARIGQARGRFHDWEGIPLMPTFHPSYLLRQPDEESARREKRKLWEDMLQVMEKLAMPVTERQRGFFR